MARIHSVRNPKANWQNQVRLLSLIFETNSRLPKLVSRYHNDTIKSLAALLSAMAEAKNSLHGKSAWAVCSMYLK